MDKNVKISLVLNIIVFVFAVVGSIFCFGEIYIIYTKPLDHGIRLLKFFTVQSNVFAGITSLLYIIYLLKSNNTKKPIPMTVHILRYIATINLVITFLVVALFLGFIVEEGYFSLYVNANFFFHFAIPVLNTISFVYFEKRPKFKLSHTFVGLIHLALYGIFYFVVVITHFEGGAVPLEYDWYAFAQLGLGIAFVCAVVVFGLGYFVAFLLYRLNNGPTTKKIKTVNNNNITNNSPMDYPDVNKNHEHDSLEFDETMDILENE